MTEPKKKRTSRQIVSHEPAPRLTNVVGGEVQAARGATVSNVILARKTWMKVDSGATVDLWIERYQFSGTLNVHIYADAHVERVDVHANESQEASISVRRGAKLFNVELRPGGQDIEVFDGAEVGEPLPAGPQGPQVRVVRLTGRVSVDALSKVLRSDLTNTLVGARALVDGCELRDVHVGDECELHKLWVPRECMFGRGVRVAGLSPGYEKISFEAAEVGDGTEIGLDVQVRRDVLIGRECVIGDAVYVGSLTRIGHRVRLAAGKLATHERGSQIGANCAIGDDVAVGIGVAVHDEVKIGAGAKIEDGAEIHKYAVIDPGVTVGHHAKVESGVRVRKDLAAGEVARTAAASLPDVTVHASAESWMLSRVADVMEAAGQKRLDKRVLQKEMPTLVETHCVKQLLRMAPPPDVATIRQMADAFSCTPKYEGERKRVPPYVASVKPKGWSGMQVMGDYDNDVVIFRTTPEVLESIVPGWTEHWRGGRDELHPWQVGFLRSLMTLGKTDAHPGGKDPYVIGWARVHFDEDHQSVLCEELQTDLAFLAWDPSTEIWYLAADTQPLAISAPDRAGAPAFVIANQIAEALTRQGIAANLWERYVREQIREGHIRGQPGQQTVILPEFTKDKKAQQDALLALAFWNAAYSEGMGYRDLVDFNPDLGTDKTAEDLTARVYRWIAVSVLGKWREFGRRISDENGDIFYEAESAEAVARAMREWPVEAAKIVDDVRGLFSDFYESALAGVLQLARKAGMKEVWVPDYETKYAIASYAGTEGSAPLEPPRSVYTELPKKFGVTQVQSLPRYMDASKWYEEAADRRSEKWPRVEIPEHPRGRRLLTNAKRR